MDADKIIKKARGKLDNKTAWELIEAICVPAPDDCWTGPVCFVNYENGNCHVVIDNLDSIDCVKSSVEARAQKFPEAVSEVVLKAFSANP